jgi:4-aminobutyrate aminotransferase-like enzyme
MKQNVAQMIERRNKLLGPLYQIDYADDPIYAERAEGVWIFDSEGRKFLDTYNNVPHIGHCHPRVVAAVSEQIGKINTSTRYLHNIVLDYAERLLDTFETDLDTLHFGCSGTEANELALRIARAHTGNQGVIVLGYAYHGHSQGIQEISTRDVSADNRPDYVAALPVLDTLRGKHCEDDAKEQYLKCVTTAIQTLKQRGHGVAALIIDTVQSCGGDIILPQGYLQQAAEMVRKAGGLFIADEVQAGFGRIGSDFWVYQGHDVMPDIVTLGKPMGNGMPLAGCVTRAAYAESLAKSNVYFNSFAGTPVTCAAGLAVLDVLEEENLQQNALQTGEYIKAGLQEIAMQYDCIGNITGSGFFIGLDLISNRETMEPATDLANKIVYGMKDRGVLSGTMGQYKNVLEIRPPMVFSRDNADIMLNVLSDTLAKLKLENSNSVVF